MVPLGQDIKRLSEELQTWLAEVARRRMIFKRSDLQALLTSDV